MEELMTKNISVQATQYVQASGALTKRALNALGPYTADAKQASAEAPAVLEALTEANMIGATDKQAAEKLMKTKTGLQVLLKEAAKVVAKLSANQKEAGDLGIAVDAKTAGLAPRVASDNDSLTNPFVGLRTSEKKASDLAYERALGL